MLTGAEDFQNRDFFRYTLRNAPRSDKTDAELRAFIKDAYDRPYLPGSSLKGAFRTALAWTGWKEIKPRLDRQAIGRSRSWAAQPLERQLFGRDPNHDLLRALHVTDCTGPQKPGEGLIVVNAQVVTMKGAGSPVELEALQGDITLRGSMTIDETLFDAMAEKQLHFGNRRHWLIELMARAQAHSQARITQLAEWFEHAEGGESIANFYRDLQKAKVGANSAVMQIGWGAGWDGKTFWTHLQQDARLFEQIVHDFRMHKASRGAPPRKAGDPFPRSKRVTMSKGRMATPLGWVQLTLEPMGEPKPLWAKLAQSPLAPMKTEATPRVYAGAPPAPRRPPTRETAAPPPPRPPAEPKAPLIESFTELPKVGDRFRGEVFSVEGRTLELFVPGLADTVAYARIEQIDTSKKYDEGDKVICEVIGLTQRGKVWEVQCRRG
jgi:CRISPR-associated protein Csm5